MFQRRSLVAIGLVCAASATPGLAQPTQTNWTDGGPDANWNTLANWNFGVPNQFIDALHTMDLSDIEVHVSDAICNSFEGKGGSGVDRFMVLLAAKKLTSQGGVFGTIGKDNFVIKLQDGTSEANRTELAAAELQRIDLVAADNHNADFFRLDVSGNVFVGTTIDVGDHADLDIGESLSEGALTVGHSGDVDIVEGLENVTVTLGALTVGPGDTRTTVTIGSVGGEDGTNGDWKLLGHVDVEIDDSGGGSGNFRVNPTAQPTVRLQGDSTLIVDGRADDGDWFVEGDASLEVSGQFEPQELTVDEGTVKALTLGQRTFAWDLTLKGGAVWMSRFRWICPEREPRIPD